MIRNSYEIVDSGKKVKKGDYIIEVPYSSILNENFQNVFRFVARKSCIPNSSVSLDIPSSEEILFIAFKSMNLLEIKNKLKKLLKEQEKENNHAKR